MPTKLDQLLESIDPQRTLDETDARVDRAVNTFSWEKGLITDWSEFKACLVGFLRHIERHVLCLRASPDVSADFDWGRCVQLLMHEYGPNGEKAAFEMARTGSEGGLYGVLRRFARQVADKYAQQEITGRISHWRDGLSVDERLAAGTEYVAKYGHLLPRELTESGGVRIRANLWKVLEKHVYLVQRMRRVGRS